MGNLSQQFEAYKASSPGNKGDDFFVEEAQIQNLDINVGLGEFLLDWKKIVSQLKGRETNQLAMQLTEEDRVQENHISAFISTQQRTLGRKRFAQRLTTQESMVLIPYLAKLDAELAIEMISFLPTSVDSKIVKAIVLLAASNSPEYRQMVIAKHNSLIDSRYKRRMMRFIVSFIPIPFLNYFIDRDELRVQKYGFSGFLRKFLCGIPLLGPLVFHPLFSKLDSHDLQAKIARDYETFQAIEQRKVVPFDEARSDHQDETASHPHEERVSEHPVEIPSEQHDPVAPAQDEEEMSAQEEQPYELHDYDKEQGKLAPNIELVQQYSLQVSILQIERYQLFFQKFAFFKNSERSLALIAQAFPSTRNDFLHLLKDYNDQSETPEKIEEVNLLGDCFDQWCEEYATESKKLLQQLEKNKPTRLSEEKAKRMDEDDHSTLSIAQLRNDLSPVATERSSESDNVQNGVPENQLAIKGKGSDPLPVSSNLSLWGTSRSRAPSRPDLSHDDTSFQHSSPPVGPPIRDDLSPEKTGNHQRFTSSRQSSALNSSVTSGGVRDNAGLSPQLQAPNRKLSFGSPNSSPKKDPQRNDLSGSDIALDKPVTDEVAGLSPITPKNSNFLVTSSLFRTPTTGQGGGGEDLTQGLNDRIQSVEEVKQESMGATPDHLDHSFGCSP